MEGVKNLVYIFLLCLIGCGSGTVTVTYHEVTEATLNAKYNREIGGYAEWNNLEGTCDIYMLSMTEYFSEEEYHRVLGHEMRHCLEGEFH